jgi:hypothetical protein
MSTLLRRPIAARTVTLWVLAALGLSIGALVYLTDRVASRSLLLPSVASLQDRHLFGVVGLWLPSFLHTFSFSLLTAAALPLARSPPYEACVAWCVVNVAFEIGQHAYFRLGIAHVLRLVLGDTSLSRILSSYFLRGTFDIGDIVAAIAGALAAAAVLYLAYSRGAQHAQ